MFTGLPGTGIGGLFYLVTVVPTMVVIEIGRTLSGRGNGRRARFVFHQALLSVTIVGIYLLTGALLQVVVPPQAMTNLGVSSKAVAGLGVSPQTVTTMIVAFPFALLFLVLAATQLLRLVLTISERFQRGSSHNL